MIWRISFPTPASASISTANRSLYSESMSGCMRSTIADPASGVNVLSRGIVGDIGGDLVVASPIYKQHFCLATGRCLEEADFSVTTYPVRLVEGQVWVRPEPIRPQRAVGKRRLVVVGNGMAGMRTVEELLQIAPDLYEIEIFGAEPHGNYNRILLSPVLSGEKQIEEIMLHPLDWYTEHSVTLHAGDPSSRSIESGGA